MKPNFLIVGAQKAGTTSLAQILNCHPDIHIPKRQIHFFDVDENYTKGLEWYESELGKGVEDEIIIGESSPRYSFQVNVPERIYKNYPDVKLIWILRNPVDRTYSNYFHGIKKGMEILSFEDALKAESIRKERNIFFGYLERSKYHLQIKNYLRFFDDKQMFYLLYEDLYNEQKSSSQINTLFKFLDLKEYDVGKLPLINQTTVPRFPLNYAKWKSRLGKNRFGTKFLNLISYFGKKSGYPEMDANTSSVLHEYFASENENLMSITNLDLSQWEK